MEYRTSSDANLLYGAGMRGDSIHLRSPIEESSTSLSLEDQILEPRRKFRKMYFASFSALLMAVAMGIAVGYSAPATYDMKNRKSSSIKPTNDDITWIGSALAIGAMTGGLIAGPIADKLGRKTTLILNIIPFIAGWFSICFAENIGTIIAGRLICGIACGVVSVAVPMYCVEIATSEVRGLLGSSFQGFMVIGNLLSAIIGSYVTWEYLSLVGAGVATLGLVCFFLMPESPRWILAQEDMDGAIRVMRNLQGNHPETEEEFFKISKDLKSQPKGLLTWRECKHPTVYKPALISVVLMFFQQFSGSNAVLFYSTSIFNASKDFLNPKYATIILGAVQVVATLLSNLIVDKAGRKVLLFLSGALMSASLTALSVYYYVSVANFTFEARFDWIPLVSLILFVTAFSLGYGSIPWLLTAEMVPLRARSTIGGLATFANGLFAFIITKTFSELEDLAHNYGAFWTYAALSFVGCFFVILVVPETKGKELEDITKYFCKTTKNDLKNSTEISISVLSK
ncbi:solute carrier family 2, facilitated glucose transporter member 8-like [Argiope bruennichi]|uniref:solute carrier family 2, facilitated glucose transporter member 8-like n=1 Tax=Argiope bruennichi TaxID=94029 RepID=UPI0024949181|nr:solute carrier family 2, facilitated glucose transporter member 8-like [Argiope bruennichi]